MSKYSNEELLDCLDGSFFSDASLDRKRRIVAIRELILNQPEVDEGFVEKWASEIYVRIIEMPEILQTDFAKGNFKLWVSQILHEAGIRIKED